MAVVETLATIELFSGLPERELREVALIARPKDFGPGETVFAEGATARGFFVVLSGRVKVFKLSPDGKEQILHILGPGEPVGEVPVFLGEPFPAHAETIEETRTLFFARADFVALVSREPSVAMNMLALLSRRLRRFTQLVERLTLRDVPARLAAYLLDLSEHHRGARTFELDIAKGLLARVLGTTPETLSRILARLREQGLIETQGRRVTIADRARLEELASGDALL